MLDFFFPSTVNARAWHNGQWLHRGIKKKRAKEKGKGKRETGNGREGRKRLWEAKKGGAVDWSETRKAPHPNPSVEVEEKASVI